MDQDKRTTLKGGAMVLAGLGLMPLTFGRALGADMMMDGDSYKGSGGDLVVHPVHHASLVLAGADKVIHVDPVGGAALYADLPPPDLILITHEHGDHFDNETLAGIVTPQTRLITNGAVFGMLADDLKPQAMAIANGESADWEGMGVSAVPAYNTTPDRMKYHPKGRDNGYVFTLAGLTVYIAGDTEDIPELGDRQGVDIAFLPMNLPFTMTEAQAAHAVAMFAPRFVYPYHYKGSDLDTFAELVGKQGVATRIVRHDWYA